MSSHHKKISLLLLNIVVVFSVFGQTNDSQLWSEIGISKKLNKKFKLELSESTKFKNNISQLNEIYTDLGLEYSLNKKFDFGINYRFEQNKEKEDFFSSKHRVSVDANYTHKIGSFKLSFRTRFQTSMKQTITQDEDEIPELYTRFRLKLAYKFSEFPIDPDISAEFYLPNNGISAYQFDKYRITLGGKYKFNKHHSVSLDYRIQSQINIIKPENLYIFILGYNFNF